MRTCVDCGSKIDRKSAARCMACHRAHIAIPPPLSEQVERFWAQVAKTATCWIWTGHRNPGGYGITCFERKNQGAHRIAYQLRVGEIPDGLVLDHLCRNPSCVRPDHLEAVTYRTNTLRGVGPAARNAAATHCHRGHPFDGENTRITPSGTRSCRTCARERTRARRQKQREANPPEPRPLATSCKRGHEFTPENTHIEADGHRRCRTCRRERQRIRLAKGQAA